MCTERDAPIVEVETMPDHVHLLVAVDPQYGLWTSSYLVATVGRETLEVVKLYVENQRNV